MSGWLKLHFKILDNPLFEKKPAARHVFVDLLLMAAWRDTVQDWKGSPVEVKRGEVMISERRLADHCGLSYQTTRTILRNLCSHGIIETNAQTHTRPAVITICNYSEYQDDQRTANARANAQPTHSQRTKGRREEDKKIDSRDSDESLVDREDAIDLLGDEIKPGRSKGQPVAEAFNLWNETAERCGLRQAATLNPSRRKSLNARLREHGLEGWQQALANVERSSFLTGGNDRGWRCDLDWLLSPSRFVKVYEGTYGNGRHAEASTAGLTPKQIQQMVIEGTL